MKIDELIEATDDEKQAYINATSTSVEIDKIVDTLSKYKNEIALAVKCYRNGDSIHRGLNKYLASSKMMLIDPTNTERRSANTENYFNLLLSDILPSWHQFPKRSRSIIATTSPDTATRYGRRYFVLPFGDPTIAIAPKGDLWACFGAISPPDMNQFITEFCEEHKIPLNGDSSQSVVNALKQISAIAKTEPNHHSIYEKYDEILYNYMRSDDIIDRMNRTLSPEANSFKMKSLSTLDTFRLIKNELWFSEKAILIAAEIANDVLGKVF